VSRDVALKVVRLDQLADPERQRRLLSENSNSGCARSMHFGRNRSPARTAPAALSGHPTAAPSAFSPGRS
jgi:hypothetical protein